MLVYCLLALWHIVASWVNGISSGAWDTTAELTTLAYNSGNTDAMRNTGAGIQSSRTMRKVAMVSAADDRPGLVFGEDPRRVEALEINHSYR